ncbi:hypothetical protein G6L16_006670 [Agrobacterium tumefaciens]|uniref:hypothetical protein n=1 Tax=Agrobacterium tumefaciens TaxID=358 RepID=UPI001572D0F2|nr:hypothetical protein [Agrobacterium tumefaciens]NSZ63020.1 hypothetical protein [Agrobacterium tumefaciens]NTA69390.1 hypothetical protein [Agrobacterium tumefaciens]WIE39183.1 hypothetical protein G6L16_006670 [Agrobacterium tumefaciens]
MAKGTIGKSTGTSKIRFIMVEAEIADGDIGQITQAIQNALRTSPQTAAPQRLGAPGSKTATRESELDSEDDFEEAEIVEIDVIPKAPRQRVARAAKPAPEVLELDMTSETSLASYVEGTTPKSHAKRFLIIAAWFKEHRNTPAVTAAHIYTGYRTLKWPVGIPDFSQPLRDLKSDQYMTTPEKGNYAINHLGIAEVDKLRNGGD